MKWTIKLVVEVVPGNVVEREVGMIERSEELSLRLRWAAHTSSDHLDRRPATRECVRRHAASFKPSCRIRQDRRVSFFPVCDACPSLFMVLL